MKYNQIDFILLFFLFSLSFVDWFLSSFRSCIIFFARKMFSISLLLLLLILLRFVLLSLPFGCWFGGFEVINRISGRWCCIVSRRLCSVPSHQYGISISVMPSALQTNLFSSSYIHVRLLIRNHTNKWDLSKVIDHW